jgi:hypothetical protein
MAEQTAAHGAGDQDIVQGTLHPPPDPHGAIAEAFTVCGVIVQIVLE